MDKDRNKRKEFQMQWKEEYGGDRKKLKRTVSSVLTLCFAYLTPLDGITTVTW
jgi:hypothetical protein